MFTSHYDGWVLSRMRTIAKYLPSDFFKQKTLLELGGGYGHNGNKFHELGAIVTSSDARVEHLENGKKLYPHLHFLHIDGDRDKILSKYDVILHWGLLYHLKEIENHLKEVCDHCDVLLLETEVCDSNDENFSLQTVESGYDQAFNSHGIRPSAPYVEKVLTANGFLFRRIDDPIVNSSFHVYDWQVTESKTWRHGLRRFWICWKPHVGLQIDC